MNEKDKSKLICKPYLSLFPSILTVSKVSVGLMIGNLHFKTKGITRLWMKKLVNAERISKFVPLVSDDHSIGWRSRETQDVFTISSPDSILGSIPGE